jgi:hypothetical protein
MEKKRGEKGGERWRKVEKGGERVLLKLIYHTYP